LLVWVGDFAVQEGKRDEGRGESADVDDGVHGVEILR
jgi:hypothetical protein